MPARTSTAVQAGLIAASCVPVLSYGAQAVAIAFYPGYDIRTDVTNLLGSDFASVPQIHNTGAILTGLAAIAGAYGIHMTLRAFGSRLILTWLTTLAIVSTGVTVIWGAIYHMPDTTHNAPLAISAAMLFLPLLLVVTLLRVKDALAMKLYLVLNLLVFAALFPFVGGLVEYDRAHYVGLVQRGFSLTVFVAIGVVGAFLLRRLKRDAAAGAT